ALRTELATSAKEMAEHLMLVDLERHDLSSVCEPGSVHWTDCRIEALANVQHLVSGVGGQLSSETSAGEALSALFPGGSITGCPKIVTMAAIDELEKAPRSAWTGSIGHLNQSAGQADWNILIRTMEARSGPDNWHATVQAGGGVVIDSSPADEVEEARWKAAAVTEATWGFRTGFSSEELPEREVG
ncbi:TPA: aminodeoxychorismate synthase, component I, partial [Candidatus Thalassarchaeaceae archaeon]